MRTPYEEYSAAANSGSSSLAAKYSQNQNQLLQQQQQNLNQNYSQNSAIPYHARENSLPFSYGQIGKTSTPLRQNRTAANQFGNRFREFDDIDFGRGDSRKVTTTTTNLTDSSLINNNNNNSKERNYNYNNKSFNSSGGGSDTEANMIKTQPRLTSPLLVRKTLASRSPTRNANTNTISNVYRFETQSDRNGINGNGIGGSSNFINQKNKVNGSDDSSYTNGNGGGIYSGTLRKTPTRNEFEDLLRERREKVYNEYRATTHDTYTSKKPPPEPPQRQYLPIRSSYTNGHTKPTTNSKYNFDFEFNLNLDEVDLAAAPPRRAHTIDRSSLQQYRTKDIQLPAAQSQTTSGHVVERNYHTISSSNANSYRENTARSAYERPPLEADYTRRLQSQSPSQQQSQPQHTDHLLKLQQYTQSHSPQPPQQQRIEEHLYATTTTAYGNGNVPGYGNNNNSSGNISNNNNMKIHIDNVNSIANNHNNGSNGLDYGNRATLGAAQNRSIDLSGPIYATTTKQQQQQQQGNRNTINNTSINYNENITTYQRNVRSVEPDFANLDNPLNGHNGQASPVSPTSSTFGTRPETPAFPVTPRTPFGSNAIYNVPIIQQSSPSPQPQNTTQHDVHNYSAETIYNTNYRPRLNSSLSMANSEPQEVAAHLVKFAKDSSKFWYKPNLSREEAISLLLNAVPGTFLVRDSTTYKNAYGLVLRVAQPPPGSASGKPDELVRHFLIEPTTRGVRLKGCANEPVFTSLSALVYEHSINQLALPCLLRIPEQDVAPPLIEPTPAQKQLLTQGAACNVLWLYSCETESLTGEEAIRKAIRQMYALKPLPTPTEVHFKVSQQGITLTDNTRKKFFRKHYAADMISFCAIDPDHRQWTMQSEAAKEDANQKAVNVGALKKTIFAFVARRSPSSKDNQCHVFCDLAIMQPASAIVSFANKTLPTEKQKNFVL